MRASTYQLLSMLSYTTSWFSEWTKSSVSPAGRSIALYLTVRFFSVRVGAATSSSLPMATGVPCTWLSPRPHAVYCVCRSSRSTDIRLWCSLQWICWRYSVVYQGVSTSDGRHWLTARMCRRTAILVLEQCTVIESKQVCRCTFRHTWPIEEFHLTITDISSWLYSRCCRQSVYTGSYTGQHILFDRHVNNVVKNCTYHLHALRHIRASLPMKSLTCWLFPLLVFELTIVTLFFGMAAKNWNCYNVFSQNRAAKIVRGSQRIGQHSS